MIPLTRPIFGTEEAEAVARVFERGLAPEQPEVAALEHEFEVAVGARAAVAVSSGTAALHLALVAAGVGPGDEVVVPSLTGIIAANTVHYVGGTVAFADVDATTVGLTPAGIEAARTPRTKAVVAVHPAGTPTDVVAIRAHCDPLGIVVVEDAAGALGSTLHDRPVGGHSSFVALSLAADHVVTSGEGGVVTVDDPTVASRLRRLRNHGSQPWTGRTTGTPGGTGVALGPRYREWGWSYRLSEIQASIARVQLARLPLVLHRRRWLAEQYRTGLVEQFGLEAAGDPPHGTTNYEAFWIVVPERSPVGRDELVRILRANGITSRRGFVAAHQELAYRGHEHRPMPVTERLAARSLFLPLFHELEEQDVQRIVDVVGDAVQAASSVG